MECRDPEIRGIIAGHGKDAFPHLGGGLVREGQRQDRPRRDASLANEIGDAAGDGPSLSRSGPGENQQRAVRRGHRLPLARIEVAEDILIARWNAGAIQRLRIWPGSEVGRHRNRDTRRCDKPGVEEVRLISKERQPPDARVRTPDGRGHQESRSNAVRSRCCKAAPPRGGPGPRSSAAGRAPGPVTGGRQ